MKYRGEDSITCPNCDQLFFLLDESQEARARVKCRRCHLEFCLQAKETERTYKILFDSAVDFLDKTGSAGTLASIRLRLSGVVCGQTRDKKRLILWPTLIKQFNINQNTANDNIAYS